MKFKLQAGLSCAKLGASLYLSCFYCHTRLHLGFSAKLRIWQVPACKMEPRSGNISWKNHPPRPYGFFLLNILNPEYGVSWQCMEGVWGLSREGQEGVCNVNGRCLENIMWVSGSFRTGQVQMIFTIPNVLLTLIFKGPNLMLHYRFSAIFLSWVFPDLIFSTYFIGPNFCWPNFFRAKLSAPLLIFSLQDWVKW